MPSRVAGGARERRSRVRCGREIARRGSEMTAAVLPTDAGSASVSGDLCSRLAIVGCFDGTHVGGSLWRAARHLGIATAKFDFGGATRLNRILRAVLWHSGYSRPPSMHRFSKSVVVGCGQSEPEILIAT